MKTNALGKTGIRVTELGHGTLIFGCLQARLPTEEGAAALRRSYELGVRFVDTAQAYDSYRHIRRFLDDTGARGQTVIASKSHARTRDAMATAIDETLRELRLEHVDVMHMHALQDQADLEARQGALDALREARAAGKIRAIGISSHSVDAFRAIADEPDIAVLLPILNRKSLGLTRGTTEELLAALRPLRAQGRGLYAMKAFAGGHLIPEMEAALAYVRGLGMVDAAAVGMKTPAEVEIDVGLFETGRLRPKDREQMKHFTKRLIIYDRCKRCGRCVKACEQGAMVLGEKSAVNLPEKCILCGYCAESCPDFLIRVV